MVRFFNMVCFNIWNFPNIAWILTKWISGEFSFIWSFKMFLVRVFLGNANIV